MDQTSTLDELANFYREEKNILESLGLQGETGHPKDASVKLEPKKETVDRILSYSKALSVRKSNVIGSVEMILN